MIDWYNVVGTVAGSLLALMAYAVILMERERRRERLRRWKGEP